MHRNSHKNKLPHHLYEIFDKEEQETYKYGISSDPIDEDGLSKRIRKQLSLLNSAANWLRYFARILIQEIAGRRKAEEIEDTFIEKFEAENGKMPRGNLRKNRKRKE